MSSPKLDHDLYEVCCLKVCRFTQTWSEAVSELKFNRNFKNKITKLLVNRQNSWLWWVGRYIPHNQHKYLTIVPARLTCMTGNIREIKMSTSFNFLHVRVQCKKLVEIISSLRLSSGVVIACRKPLHTIRKAHQSITKKVSELDRRTST